MHAANIKPTKKWTKLEDLITSAIGETATLKEDGLYKIQNNGGGDAYVISQALEPTKKSGIGFRLFPAHCYTYKKSVNVCFIRCNNACNLHVEEVE